MTITALVPPAGVAYTEDLLDRAARSERIQPKVVQVDDSNASDNRAPKSENRRSAILKLSAAVAAFGAGLGMRAQNADAQATTANSDIRIKLNRTDSKDAAVKAKHVRDSSEKIKLQQGKAAPKTDTQVKHKEQIPVSKK